MSGVLPNLLVAGVPKAGTGSLFSYLGQHPDICSSTVKEIGYFTPLRREGGALPSVESYKVHFSHWAGQRYAMEATPNYCYGGERLRAGIKDTHGRPRIVISLRDPIDRLWSAYAMQRTRATCSASRPSTTTSPPARRCADGATRCGRSPGCPSVCTGSMCPGGSTLSVRTSRWCSRTT